MANSIRLKRRETTGTAITSSTLPTLAAGELAVDLAASDPVLYVGDDTGAVRKMAVGLTQTEADARYRQLKSHWVRYEAGDAHLMESLTGVPSTGMFTIRPTSDTFTSVSKSGGIDIIFDAPTTHGVSSIMLAQEANTTLDDRSAHVDYTDSTDLPSNSSIVTRTRGDARYLKLSGGTATGSIKLDDAQLEIKIPRPKAMLRLETSGNAADQRKVVLRMSPQGDLLWMLNNDAGVAVQQYRMDRAAGPPKPETILRRSDADSLYVQRAALAAPAAATGTDAAVINQLIADLQAQGFYA